MFMRRQPVKCCKAVCKSSRTAFHQNREDHSLHNNFLGSSRGWVSETSHNLTKTLDPRSCNSTIQECWKELKNQYTQYTISLYRQKKHQPNSFISRDVGILKNSVWPLLFVLFSCFFQVFAHFHIELLLQTLSCQLTLTWDPQLESPSGSVQFIQKNLVSTCLSCCPC